MSLRARKAFTYTTFFALCAIMFILFFRLNRMTGLAADDYLYFFEYNGHRLLGNPQRLAAITDIIRGMKTHYMVCNGRLPAHFWLQLFTFFDKVVFDFVNSLFFVALGLLIYFHANFAGRVKIPLLIFIFGFEWLGTYLPGVSYLWYSAAFNYLWTSVLILAFLLLYRAHAVKGGKCGKAREITACAAMLILGFFSGWTNENMGGAVILCTALFIGYYKLRGIAVLPRFICGSAGSCIGFAVLILAPGNDARLSGTKYETNVLLHLNWSLSRVGINMMRAALLFAVVAFTALLVYRIKRKKIDWLLPGVYLLPGGAAAAALILSPEAPPRAFLGANMLFACGVFSMASQLLDFELSHRLRAVVASAAVCTALVFSFVYITNYYAFKNDKMIYDATEQYVIEQREAGEKNIVLPYRKMRTHFWSMHGYMSGLVNNGKNDPWVNAWVAQYYGVDSIRTALPPKGKAKK